FTAAATMDRGIVANGMAVPTYGSVCRREVESGRNVNQLEQVEKKASAPGARRSLLHYLVPALFPALIALVPLMYSGTTDEHRARLLIASVPLLLAAACGPWSPIAPSRLLRFGAALLLA